MLRQIDVGSILAERYEIQASLGQGGMGRVFEVLDRKLGPVAVKVLLPGVDLSPDILARFRDEVKLARKVRHRNVCAIYEYEEDGDVPFIVMELVDGSDLKSALHKVGSLEWEDGFEVAIQISEGLSAIHEAGIVHRDLKPANIMRDSRNVVRVMDFGIAKGETHAGLTDDGKVVGTIDYMSPEQFKSVLLDQRSDIYSFGVVIYELFTGRVPFRGDVAAIVQKHLSEPPPLHGVAADRIPRSLVPVLERALSKDRGGRYTTAAEMRAALQVALEKTRREPTDPISSSDWRRSRSLSGTARASYPPEARLLVPALVRALASPERVVRIGAAEALIRTPAPAARSALEVARHDPDEEVRERAGVALLELDAPPLEDARPVARISPEPSDEPPPAPATPAPEELQDTSDIDVEAKPTPAPPAEVVPAPAPPVGAALHEAIGTPVVVPRPGRAVPYWLLVVPIVGLAIAFLTVPKPGQAPAPALAPATTMLAEAPPTPVPSAVAAVPPAAAPTMFPGVTSPARPAATPRPTVTTLPAPAATMPTTPPPTPTPEPPVTSLAPTPAPTELPTPPPTPPPPSPGALVEASDPALVRPVCASCPAPQLPLIAEDPRYLPSLRKSGGLVELRILVDENGRVTDAAVVKGDKALADSALRAVRLWKYTPARKQGVGVKVWLIVPVQFVLPPPR